MKPWLAAILALLAAVPAAGQPRTGGPPDNERAPWPERHQLRSLANPSALIAAEIALSQLSREKGESKALRKMAAEQAVTFNPDRVSAQDWLKKRDEPAEPTRRDAGTVWMSCDGSYGVVEGAWRQSGATGPFITVWQRQKDGEYLWLLDFRGEAQTAAGVAGDSLEVISARIADCTRVGDAAPPDNADTESLPTMSRDKTLVWQEALSAGGTWTFALKSWNGTAYGSVLDFTGKAWVDPGD